MGIDKLPAEIRNSETLTGNELAILASLENIPEKNRYSRKRKYQILQEKTQISKTASSGR